MYGFDNNTLEIYALAKHMIAETYYFGPTLMYAPDMSEDNVAGKLWDNDDFIGCKMDGYVEENHELLEVPYEISPGDVSIRKN